MGTPEGNFPGEEQTERLGGGDQGHSNDVAEKGGTWKEKELSHCSRPGQASMKNGSEKKGQAIIGTAAGLRQYKGGGLFYNALGSLPTANGTGRALKKNKRKGTLSRFGRCRDQCKL